SRRIEPGLPFIQRDSYLEDIHQTQFKDTPKGFGPYSLKELKSVKDGMPFYKSLIPRQEAGVRPSPILPYELYVDGEMHDKAFVLQLKADNTVFGNKSAGAPFTVYVGNEAIRSYAVKSGDSLSDQFAYGAEGRLDIQV